MMIPALAVRLFCEHIGWRQFFMILRLSLQNKSKLLIDLGLEIAERHLKFR